MRPLLLVSGDFVKTGGMDRANYALADYVSRQNTELHLVAHRADDELLSRPGVTFHRVAKPLNSYLLATPLLDRMGRKVAATIQARGGRVIVNGGNSEVADVNWVHYVHAAYEPQTATGMLRRIKRRIERRRFLSDERRCLSAARLVIVNSERTRRHLVEHLAIPSERIRTIYYGNDTACFRSPTEAERLAARTRLGFSATAPFVAFIGALGDRRKGFDTLFEAWRLLASSPQGWDANLLVMGHGAELPAWTERARQANLTTIHFLGFRRDVPDVLRACDAVVAPTRYEAYGLGVHEALCCGLPAFVSADSGIAERFPASLSTFLLPDPNDAADLAERLRRWRNDMPGFHNAATPLASALAAQSWDDMARAILAALEHPSPLAATNPTAPFRSDLTGSATAATL